MQLERASYFQPLHSIPGENWQVKIFVSIRFVSNLQRQNYHRTPPPPPHPISLPNFPGGRPEMDLVSFRSEAAGNILHIYFVTFAVMVRGRRWRNRVWSGFHCGSKWISIKALDEWNIFELICFPDGFPGASFCAGRNEEKLFFYWFCREGINKVEGTLCKYAVWSVGRCHREGWRFLVNWFGIAWEIAVWRDFRINPFNGSPQAVRLH